MVEEIERVQQKIQWPLRKISRELGLNYSTFMRWKTRRDRGEALLKKPGPGKVKPFDLRKLVEDLRALSQGQRRTSGAGALYEEYKKKVSRRMYQELVRSIRREARRGKRRITWDSPRLIWSMDDTEYEQDGRKRYIHTVQDLGSQYKFLPVTGNRLCAGEDVAAHLEWLFKTYGPPLILKRDNHSNLNNHWVDDVLNRWHVIPLNSPPHYPPYNGSVEKAQDEIKRRVAITADRTHDFQIAAELAVYELNLKERRSLKQRCSCELFFSRKQLIRQYHSRRRKEVMEEILALVVRSIMNLGLHTDREIEGAWRLAVETWLRVNNHITVSKNGKVLPYFP